MRQDSSEEAARVEFSKGKQKEEVKAMVVGASFNAEWKSLAGGHVDRSCERIKSSS